LKTWKAANLMILFAFTLLSASGIFALGGGKRGNPIEVGTVEWGRDFEGALAASAGTGKPVLVLFQEVPG